MTRKGISSLLSLVMAGIVLVAVLAFTSCTTTEPRMHVVNGRTKVYTTKKLCGIPISTKVEEIKTPEQAKADLEVKELEDQQKAEAKRARIAVWMGAILIAGAVACAVIGYLTKGWKRWGGLAVLCATGGALIWGFVEWIGYLKWLALLLPVAGLILFLYENKERGRDPKAKNDDTGRED